ncbi:hypothetical protein O9992_30890 [Vibrio lentus]|nr:hypothetical protein [Vibrio lentus]
MDSLWEMDSTHLRITRCENENAGLKLSMVALSCSFALSANAASTLLRMLIFSTAQKTSFMKTIKCSR